MQRIIQLFICLCTLCSTHAVWADYLFYSSDPKACESLAGQWAGHGKASNLFFKCAYTGYETISSLDSEGRFIISFYADKKSGGSICPAHLTDELKGTCVNGAVTIKTGYGKLKGEFTKDSGDAKGVLTYSPGASADVVVKMQKLGG